MENKNNKEIERIVEEFENEPVAWHIDTRGQWLKKKLNVYRNTILEEIINELESNPNFDGNISPNLRHWIEQKQAQLKRKFLTPK